MAIGNLCTSAAGSIWPLFSRQTYLLPKDESSYFRHTQMNLKKRIDQTADTVYAQSVNDNAEH